MGTAFNSVASFGGGRWLRLAESAFNRGEYGKNSLLQQNGSSLGISSSAAALSEAVKTPNLAGVVKHTAGKFPSDFSV